MTILKEEDDEQCDYCDCKTEYYRFLTNHKFICEKCCNNPLLFLEPINHNGLFDKPGIYSDCNMVLEIETPLSGFILKFEIMANNILYIEIDGYGSRKFKINKFDVICNYHGVMGSIEDILEEMASENGVDAY